MLLAEVIVPQMFTAYAEDLGCVESSGLHHFQYFCEHCDQIFASAWGGIPGAISWCERGSYFYCTNCGKRHHDNVVYINRKEAAPYKIRLAVKSYENLITFEAYSKTLRFDDYLRTLDGSYKEIFRFNIPKQKASFTIYDNGEEVETLEVGNPYELDVLNKSILRFFRPNSMANKEQKLELSRILRVFRESVQCKLEKHLGYRVPSMFVSQGQYYGTFLLPILNMAFRLNCPDAPNLPIIYREEPENVRQFWNSKMLKDYNYDFVNEVISLTRQKRSFVSAMIAVHSLPEKPTVRKLINEDPFGIYMLTKAFAICQNYDNAIRLYHGLSNLTTWGSGRFKELFRFIQKIKPLYDESGIIYLVDKAKEFQIWDCIGLYSQLNAENRKSLKAEKVRLRDLHDWMSLRHKKQTHVNIKFDVPDHIINRLTMQSNRLKFFLPGESMELLEAGYQLHNCVASYGKAMKDNQKWIVLVADDKGKLAACLEVRGKALVQAKLDKNIPVSENEVLNNEIVSWAKDANIRISTQDVRLPKEKDTKITA